MAPFTLSLFLSVTRTFNFCVLLLLLFLSLLHFPGEESLFPLFHPSIRAEFWKEKRTCVRGGSMMMCGPARNLADFSF